MKLLFLKYYYYFLQQILDIMPKSTETIQDLKVTKITAPSDKYNNEYNVIITYDNTIYTNNINEVLFESKFYGWDMFETLLLNGIIKGKVGDIDCFTECSVIKDKKILKITLTLTLDKKPMKIIQEQFDFKLNEKILEFDDKISLAIANLKNEVNIPVLYPQSIIKDYIVTTKKDNPLGIYKNTTQIVYNSGIYIKDSNTKQFVVFMPFIVSTNPTLFNSFHLSNSEKFYSDNTDKKVELNIIGVECDFIIEHLVEPKDQATFKNYKTDFQTYINLWKYLEGLGLVKLTKDATNITDWYYQNDYIKKLYNKLCSKLITESDVNINHIKLFDERLVLFTNPNRQTHKRKITIYNTISEFLEERDQFKTYQFIDYNEKNIIVEELNN